MPDFEGFDRDMDRERELAEIVRQLITGQQHTETLHVHDFADIGIGGLVVPPTVFNPARSFGGAFMARAMNRHPEVFDDKTVADVGCGSGLLGLVAARLGARHVTFSDINPVAIDAVRVNAAAQGISSVDARVGSLLDPMLEGERFDVIVANLPGATGVPGDVVEQSILSDDSMLPTFLEQAREHLFTNGVVLMPTSSKHTHIRHPDAWASRYGLRDEVLDRMERPDGSVQSLIAMRKS